MVTRTGFPTEKLIPVQGCIRAAIFEDPDAGLERDMYWGIDVEFAPMRYRGERIKPLLSCEWMILDIMDWKLLEDAELSGEYEDIEASFFVWEHDLARNSRLEFLEREAATFTVRYHVVVEFSGSDEEDADPELAVDGELALPYLGFYIDRNILDAVPGNESQAKELASHYADLTCYREPRIDNGVFHFDPSP